MKALDQYNLPLKALKEGTDILTYEIDAGFFQSFENELVGDCKIHQEVVIEKRSELITLTFIHGGYIQSECDRCLEKIKIAVSGTRRFVLKFVEEAQEDEEDVIYVIQDEDYYDLSPLINEGVTLSLPMIKVYDCFSDPNAPCNKEVLKYLNRGASEEVSPVWEQLKNLKLEDK